jgi:hypothetical protein
MGCAKTAKEEPKQPALEREKTTQKPPQSQFRIVEHDLTIRLEPQSHTIEATDRLTLEPVKMSGADIVFGLNRKLAITGGILFKKETQLPSRTQTNEELLFLNVARLPDKEDQSVDNVVLRLPEPAERCFLTVSYKGSIYDPPRQDEQLRFVVGGKTGGTIGPEGVFLHSGTYWYPTTDEMMAAFKLRATSPKGWEVVGQGTRTERKANGDSLVTEWSCAVPSDSYCLVAGQYVVQEEKRDNVTIATYFFPEEKELSKKYIDTAAQYISYYSRLFGPYPFGWFSIVENFFPTGYGMPSYTLLGHEVVKIPHHLGPGGLGHEIVHNWWGNYVVPDYENGNWCEGLTTYLSNYLWVEKEEGAEKARDYRQRQMLKYSVFVNDSNEYPVRLFTGKTEQVDNEIGYGKCSMMFHMLRRMLGDENFFGALSEIVRVFGGKRTRWEDLQTVLERGSGRDLSRFFDEWLDRKGAPMLSMTAPTVSKAEDGRWQTDFSILMANPEPYHLTDVEIQGGSKNSSSCALIAVQASETKVRIAAEKPATTITVDPDYHIFRRLAPEEYPACLNVTCNDAHRVLVRPSGGDAQEREVYEKLAARIVHSGGWAVLQDTEVTEDVLSSSSLLVLGRPGVNLLASRLAPRVELARIVRIEPTFFLLNEERCESSNESLLISFRNPWNEKHHVTLFMGLSAEAASMAQRLLFYYGWENWYIFSGERVTKRGMHEAPRNALTAQLR